MAAPIRTAALLLALAAPACGSSSGLSGPDGPLTRTVVASGELVGVPSGEGGNNPVPATRTVAFSVPAGGAMEATVNWGAAANRFTIAFYPAGCTAGQLGSGGCQPLLQGDSSQKPAYVHLHAEAAAAYTLGIVNLGPGTDSASYEVTLTR
jgi:hypothetical protein